MQDIKELSERLKDSINRCYFNGNDTPFMSLVDKEGITSEVVGHNDGYILGFLALRGSKEMLKRLVCLPGVMGVVLKNSMKVLRMILTSSEYELFRISTAVKNFLAIPEIREELARSLQSLNLMMDDVAYTSIEEGNMMHAGVVDEVGKVISREIAKANGSAKAVSCR